jgi:hypothetical protein
MIDRLHGARGWWLLALVAVGLLSGHDSAGQSRQAPARCQASHDSNKCPKHLSITRH